MSTFAATTVSEATARREIMKRAKHGAMQRLLYDCWMECFGEAPHRREDTRSGKTRVLMSVENEPTQSSNEVCL